jgi:hypothetical protein
MFFVHRPARLIQVTQVIFFKSNFHIVSFDTAKIMLFFDIRKKANYFSNFYLVAVGTIG